MYIAINGFGRIGRLILRAAIESQKYPFNIVAVNDLQPIDTAIHLLKYDSVHGLFNANIQKISDNEFSVNGNIIKYTSEKSPSNLPSIMLNISLILECTGIFKDKKSCEEHLLSGAKKVLISAPADNVDNTIVFGVNNEMLQNTNDIVVSCASCTTNCLAPIVKVLHQEFGILSGFLTTVHSYTGDQTIIDTNHKDLRRTRAAAANIIPTSTGATKAIEKIFPELSGKLSGLAIRVPTPNVSLVDFSVNVQKETSVEEVNNKIIQASEEKLKNILSYTHEELVSSDFNHTSYSSVVDLKLTKIINKNFIHIVSWYDNEFGFANRMLDLANLML